MTPTVVLGVSPNDVMTPTVVLGVSPNDVMTPTVVPGVSRTLACDSDYDWCLGIAVQTIQ